MTNPAALDRAVREVTTPTERVYADRDLWTYRPNRPWLYALAPRIRARYRQIVEGR